MHTLITIAAILFLLRLGWRMLGIPPLWVLRIKDPFKRHEAELLWRNVRRSRRK